jgi:hypothetical protein
MAKESTFECKKVGSAAFVGPLNVALGGARRPKGAGSGGARYGRG